MGNPEALRGILEDWRSLDLKQIEETLKFGTDESVKGMPIKSLSHLKEKQVQRGYITCDYFIVAHCIHCL